MNDLLDDKERIDPPEPTRFECTFCHEDSPISEHNIVNGKDICEICLDDLDFCKFGKCFGLCECEE